MAGGHLNFDFDVRAGVQPVDPERVLRVAIIGRFGQTSDRVMRRRVSIDTLDDLLSDWVGTLQIASPVGEPDLLEIRELDDFHPDEMCRSLDSLRAICQQRSRASDLPEALSILRQWGVDVEGGSTTTVGDAGGALDALAERPISAGVQRSLTSRDAAGRAQAWIDRLVAPHLAIASTLPQSVTDAFDLLLASRLRGVLRHSRFRELERMWRGVHFLLTRLEDSVPCEIHLVDLGDAQLADAVRGEGGALVGILQQASSGQSWEAIAICQELGGEDELELLSDCAAVATSLSARLIVDAHPTVCNCSLFCDLPAAWKGEIPPVPSWWRAFQESRAAENVIAAGPRFLLRYPYGELYDSLDVGVEELEFPLLPDGYLWADGVFPTLLSLLSCSSAPRATDLSGMICCWHEVGGEQFALPFVECWLPERHVVALRQRGITPLVGVRNSDRLQIGPLQTVCGAYA